MSAPTYAYALNNPLRYVDSNGLTVGVWGTDFTAGSDTIFLITLLSEARSDPCSRDLITALHELPDQILIEVGTGATETTTGQTSRRGPMIRVKMDSFWIQEERRGSELMSRDGTLDTLIHELYHAIIVAVLGEPEMDANSQHMIINGIEPTGLSKGFRELLGKRKSEHVNLKSLMDRWRACRCQAQ